jgi:hypothetical protein
MTIFSGGREMRRILIALTVLLAVGMTATAAMAQINEACAPSGTHLQSGTIGCTVGANGLTVTCSGFQLNGVGNTNATVTLTANYSAIIDCRNPGGNIVESHETDFEDTSTATVPSTRNGRLAVPPQTANPDLALAEPCPNPNWTPEFQPETLQLDSFTYTLRFAGFDCDAITITGPDL